MGDLLIMSAKERKRKVILEGVINHQYSLIDAAERMEVGYRQACRIKNNYLKYGDAGLIHKARGKPSGRAKPKEIREIVIKHYKDKYCDFGPTLAAEFLEDEQGIKIHPETLRLWLKSEGLWVRKRKRSPYRQRRERRERFGEMLQIDGSDHHWFGPDHPRCCLLNMVDDATGRSMAMLDTGETTLVLLTVLKKWIQRYGIPQEVYVDLKSVYISCSDDSWSVFQAVCHKLDIRIIKAYSPQAKGRVERSHGVYQDRFVKELKLKGITDIKQANELLEKKVTIRLNQNFAKLPKSSVDAHRDPKPLGDLDQIICWEAERQLRNDYTVQIDSKLYQIIKQSKDLVQPKNKLVVRTHLNGKKTFWHKGKRLIYRKLEEQPKPVPKKKKVLARSPSEIARRNRKNSPWSWDMMLKGYKQ